MKGLGSGDQRRGKHTQDPRTSLIFGGLTVSISDSDRKRGQQVRARLAPPFSMPMTPLLSFFVVQKCVHLPIEPLWSASHGSHLGAAGGTMCLPHSGLLLPLQGIFLTHSLGWVPGLLGFPPASWYRAALQATRESLSWFPSSHVGRAFSQGWEVSGIPRGIGVGAL